MRYSAFTEHGFESNGARMSKFEAEVQALTRGSRMAVRVNRQGTPAEVTRVVIAVSGPAARIPSTSNSRLNMFPKAGILSTLKSMVTAGPEVSAAQLKKAAERAWEQVRKTHVASTINPEHKIRLEALTRLWDNVEDKPFKGPLRCDKENPWLVTLHLHGDLDRVDSHNLTKPMCDWLQAIGLISNDKFVDCYPSRNSHYQNQLFREFPGMFFVAMRRLEDVKSNVESLLDVMLS